MAMMHFSGEISPVLPSIHAVADDHSWHGYFAAPPLAWRDARLERPEIFYWRTSNGEEVDFVIESGETLLPIEVKTANKPGTSDTKHVRVFREEYGKRCRPGLVLHTGESIEWLAPGILACPWWRVI